MREYDIIRSIANQFPRHSQQQNAPFTCDAELVWLDDQLWGLTLDDFSPEEDRFTTENPELLGANLAIATLSDLLAAGAEPAWYMHALSLPGHCDEEFITGLTRGISQVLARSGCALCGGDIGTAESWRYCGFAMGRIPDNKALTHCLPLQSHTLWITGALGAANIAAFTGIPTPPFALRGDAARLIRKVGTACIDTSSGFFDALWLLHEQNPHMHFTIDLTQVPLADGVVDITRALGIPALAALLGGAGEYELLFTTPEQFDDVQQLLATGAFPIGIATPGDAGIILTQAGQQLVAMSYPPPCPRDIANLDDYIRAVIRMAREMVEKD